MIRSEKDFLDNVIGAIFVGRHGKADPDYILQVVEQMVRGRLQIFSGLSEPGCTAHVTFHQTPEDFKPIEIKGKPASETIIEDRR